MNKKLEEFLLKYNLQIKGNEAYGYIRGYEVNFYYFPTDNIAPVRWHVTFNIPDNIKAQILEEIRKVDIKKLKYDVDIFGMLFGIDDITLGKLLTRLDEVLNFIFDILDANGVKDGSFCPLCGEEFVEESKVYDINGIKHKLHVTCGKEIADAFDESNKEFEALPNNVLKGTLGALIGAVVGCVSYVIFYLLGFISTISAIISIFLGGLLYRKFGGKPNFIMIIITSVLTIVTLMLTVYLLYGFTATGIAAEYGITLSITEAFKVFMEEPEFSKAFYSDLAMTVLFSVVGAIYQAISLSKAIHRKNKIQ